MKTTVDIPENLLKDSLDFSGARSKKDAIVTALEFYTRHERVRRLSGEIQKKPLNFRSNDEIEKADFSETTRQLEDFKKAKS